MHGEVQRKHLYTRYVYSWYFVSETNMKYMKITIFWIDREFPIIIGKIALEISSNRFQPMIDLI
jgi:hypothetical protein